MTPTTIEWPKITIGGVEDRFTLRYAYSADYQLARWGKNLASANKMELAAAMCSTRDADGNWHSAGFNRAIDLADLIEPGEELPLIKAVDDAVNFRYPEVKAQATPGNETAPSTPANDSSNSGLFPVPDPALDSVTVNSGA